MPSDREPVFSTDGDPGYDQGAARPVRHAHPRETKPSTKTTELIVFVLAVVGVLAASYLVDSTATRADYFRADQAWTLIVVLTVGYLLSRGLAKAGSDHHDD